MKKLLSFVIFSALLVWTWNIVHSTSSVAFETHSGIQEKLTELIKSSILLKKPAATDFVMKKIWSETVSRNKVRAVFSYGYKEPQEGKEMIEQTIDGEAMLYKEAADIAANSNDEKWILQSVKTTNDVVVFSEGEVINSGAAKPASSKMPTSENATEKNQPTLPNE